MRKLSVRVRLQHRSSGQGARSLCNCAIGGACPHKGAERRAIGLSSVGLECAELLDEQRHQTVVGLLVGLRHKHAEHRRSRTVGWNPEAPCCRTEALAGHADEQCNEPCELRMEIGGGVGRVVRLMLVVGLVPPGSARLRV